MGNPGLYVYKDGQYSSQVTTDYNSAAGVDHWKIGDRDDANQPIDGTVDEYRFSVTNRSGDWINAEYLSMTGTFITYGTEEVMTPPAVTTNSAANITAAAARLNGNLDTLGTAANVTVSFEWGLTTSYGSETTAQSANATGAFFFDLDSLDPGTTYHFRTKVVGHGTSYGADGSFETLVVPAADFTAVPTVGRAPLTVQFIDESTGDITSWLWDFGDGETSNERYPSHTYVNPGTYTVSLEVSGVGGSDIKVGQYLIQVQQELVGESPEFTNPVKPANFVASYLNISPTKIYPGQAVNISLNVANRGSSRDSYHISLNINGSIEQNRTVSLNPGLHRRVTFTIVKSMPGIYNVSVAGMHGEFQVIGIEVISSQEPAASPSMSAASAPRPPTIISVANDESDTTSVIAIPIIGVVVLAGVVAFLVTRPVQP